jgi:parallel beta-helix repeat protein
MKRKKVPVGVLIVAIAIMLLNLGAIAADLHVGASPYYYTINEALVSASPGDTIYVCDNYDSRMVGERFPITVKKDNISIVAHPGVGRPKLFVPYSNAGIVFKGVAGGTVQGLEFRGYGDIGIVVKDSQRVTVENNLIKGLEGLTEGIRIYNSQNTQVINNVVTGLSGIGIFLEAAASNELRDNELNDCGEGLFLFESSSNSVNNDQYVDNHTMGISLNDSNENVLTGVTVTGNSGWGIYVVYSDENTVESSTITDNAAGGVELAGSVGNMIDGNSITNNGDGNRDDAQVVVTKGTKTLYYTDIFDPQKYPGAVTFASIEEEKHKVGAKFDLIDEYTSYPDGDMWAEFQEIDQKLSGVYGDLDASQTASAIARIDSAIVEKEIIENSPILRPVYEDHVAGSGYKLDDAQQYNFSLFEARWIFDYKGLLSWSDFSVSLDYDGSDNNWGNADDELSLGKLELIRVIIRAIHGEIDTIKSDLSTMNSRGLLTTAELDALLGKLTELAGYASFIEERLSDIEALLGEVDTELTDAKSNITSQNVQGAKDEIDSARSSLMGVEMKGYLDDIAQRIGFAFDKIEEIDAEIPPDQTINGTALIGKTEKGGSTTDPLILDDLHDLLNYDSAARDIHLWLTGSPDFEWDDIQWDYKSLRESTGNTISSNVITTTKSAEPSVGIQLESPQNMVVNNLITNENLEEGTYELVGRLDVGIMLFSNDNKLVYNAIELIDTGIRRGGTTERYDVGQKYYFTKLAAVDTWSNPEHNMYLRTIDWMVVLHPELVHGFSSMSARVKQNRLALNFMEEVGIGIDIVNAESNRIDENLFIDSSQGAVVFRFLSNPTGIRLEKNDYFGGFSVVNNSTLPIDASKDYTPETGLFHAPVVGTVNPPAAGGAFVSANFDTVTKFQELGITRFFNATAPVLPPNLEFLPTWVKLPVGKPRTSADLPSSGTVGAKCCTYPVGWNLISMPVVPADPSVLPTVLTQYPFIGYEAATGYYAPSQVSCTEGYWLYVPWDAALLYVCIDGTSPLQDETINLANAGWHQIGTGIEGAYWANTKVTYNGTTKSVTEAVEAGWIVPVAFGYNNETGSYEVADVLHVCLGYWVYTNHDSITLTIPLTQPTPPTYSSVPMGVRQGLTPPAPPSFTELRATQAELVFTNEPNPVTDVHTTTFMVKGAMAAFVEAIKVEIYDLPGRLVYASEEIPATSLDWHTVNDHQEYLANGVYLYKLYAKVDGQWVVSELKKLAVIR